MDVRRIVLGVIVGGLSSCATAPDAGPEYAQTEYYVQLASGSYETGESATLPVEAELEGTHPVDFYVQFALERNPEILAAQRGVAARAEVIPQVTALDDPMLVDTFQPIDNHSVQTAAGRGPNTLALSQRFPWFGKLRVRGEVAEQETQMALTRLAQAQLKVIEDVHLAYYEVAFNQQAIRLTEASEELLERILQVVDARVITGLTSQQDLLRAQVELVRLKDQLITLRRQLRQSQADLAATLHTSPESDLRAVDELELWTAPEIIDGLYAAAIRCRPELQERLHAIVRDQRVEELARLQYYPDVTLGVAWQAITTGAAVSPVANGNDNVAFGVGVNIPIWRDKLRAGVREAEHRVVESARRYDATRDDTFRQIRRLLVQVRALQQQIRLYRESPDGIVPKAKQALDVSFAEYTVNKVDFQQLIGNWTDWLTFQIQLARLQTMLGQTLASLERVVGCQLAVIEDEEGKAASPEPNVDADPRQLFPPPQPDENLPKQ